MTSSRLLRLPMGAAVAALALAALPGLASGADYCVKAQPCVDAGGIKMDDLKAALAAAKATDAADRVVLGPGTFFGPFTYDGNSPLEVVGAGRDATALTEAILPAPPADDTNIVDLAGPIELRNLAIRIPQATGQRGLRLANGAAARDISVTTTTAKDGFGVVLQGGTLRDSTIAVGEHNHGVAVFGGKNLIDHADVTARYGVFTVDGQTPTLAMTRTTVHGALSAFYAGSGTVTLDSDVLVGAQIGISATPSGAGKASVVGRHLTIVGAAPALGAKPAYGAAVSVPGTGSAGMTLRDSVVDGFTYPYVRDSQSTGTATLTFDHVAHGAAPADGAIDPDSGLGTFTDTAPISAAPGFADAASGDYRLTPGSALVDAGSDTLLAEGEPPLDLGGAPRIADGDGDCHARRDVGAYERAGAPCPILPAGDGGGTAGGSGTAGATGATGATGSTGTSVVNVDPGNPLDHTAPKVTKLRAAWRKGKVTVRFSSSERGKVKVSVQRRTGKRWITVKTITISAKAGANAKVLKLRARSAKHRVAVVATDAVGNRAAAVRAKLAVPR